MAKTKNNPTPSATNKIIILLPTWLASTVKSGSATVIKKPRTKQTATNNFTLDDFVKPAPTCSPIGVIATSAPKVKKPIPKIKNNADTLKITTSLTDRLIKGVKFKTITISVTGNIDINDSLILLKSNFFMYNPNRFIYFNINGLKIKGKIQIIGNLNDFFHYI